MVVTAARQSPTAAAVVALPVLLRLAAIERARAKFARTQKNAVRVHTHLSLDTGQPFGQLSTAPELNYSRSARLLCVDDALLAIGIEREVACKKKTRIFSAWVAIIKESCAKAPHLGEKPVSPAAKRG